MGAVISNAEFSARRVPLRGTFNLRDVGGYPALAGRRVKWHTLFRSDALHALDEEGPQQLARLGLRSVVDLREDNERRVAPARLPATIQLIEIPLFRYGAPYAVPGERPASRASEVDHQALKTLDDIYLALIATRGRVLVRVIRELIQPGRLPAIVNCTGGKDRTGVVVAMVLAAVGVPDDVIVADYAASGLFLNKAFADAVAARHIRDEDYDEARARKMLSCPPELMRATLEAIRAGHGDVPNYLRRHGLTDDGLFALRDCLLERKFPGDRSER
jgi:protein-tyrosine phosphatase